MPLHASTGGGSGLEPVLLWPFSALPVSLSGTEHQARAGMLQAELHGWGEGAERVQDH